YLIFDSKMKKEMWGEAICTSTYLLNRTPTSTTDCTPIEIWEHIKPDLSRLQLFGCDAYSKVLSPLKKLDERCEKYIFVGYAPVGYRLWDLGKRNIRIARDVKFEKLTKREEDEGKSKTIPFFLKETEEDEDEDERHNENQNDSRNEDQDEEFQDRIEENSDDSIYEDSISEVQEGSYLDGKKNLQLRKSHRNRKAPDKYNDYVFLTYSQAVSGSDCIK
ncbi:Copia protein, partial [Cyphomyrmex costatus]